jgi:hypothetical protein
MSISVWGRAVEPMGYLGGGCGPAAAWGHAGLLLWSLVCTRGYHFGALLVHQTGDCWVPVWTPKALLFMVWSLSSPATTCAVPSWSSHARACDQSTALVVRALGVLGGAGESRCSFAG